MLMLGLMMIRALEPRERSLGMTVATYYQRVVGAFPLSPISATAEAHALRDVLVLAGQVGCNRLEVNSDCMDVIDVMLNGGNTLGPATAIFEECSRLCHSFTRVVFAHSLREANMAAHVLARNVEGSLSFVCHEDPSGYLVSFLADDVTVMDI